MMFLAFNKYGKNFEFGSGGGKIDAIIDIRPTTVGTKTRSDEAMLVM